MRKFKEFLLKHINSAQELVIVIGCAILYYIWQPRGSFSCIPILVLGIIYSYRCIRDFKEENNQVQIKGKLSGIIIIIAVYVLLIIFEMISN